MYDGPLFSSLLNGKLMFFNDMHKVLTQQETKAYLGFFRANLESIQESFFKWILVLKLCISLFSAVVCKMHTFSSLQSNVPSLWIFRFLCC